MEEDVILDKKNILTMKLLHYFITEKNYNPIILQGVENEIWLENLNEDCKVIRIVSNYIHNDEQFDFDVFKTKRILKKIKKKTLSLSMNVMTFFLDMGENVEEDINADPKLMCINIKDEKDIEKNTLVNEVFPDLFNKMEYTEEGMDLFMRITGDINKHNREDASQLEETFKQKTPYVTYFLIALNCIFFFVPLFLNQYDTVVDLLKTNGPRIRDGEYWRLFTGMLLHGSIFHLTLNCYALYVIGSQIESFLGRYKYIIIYIFSGLTGALLSIILNGHQSSIGASGAIFGLMGAMLYFGYYYRVYLGNVVKTQLLPIVMLNLIIGFMSPGIDNYAHIGGLIGGVVITMALGVKNKTTNFEKANGFIVAALFLAFLLYMGLVVVK